jgi:hypothetical protein
MSVEMEKLAVLKADADEGVKYCFNLALRWAVAYYIIRGALLLFSVLTSAQAVDAIVIMKSAQPIFAILVTILAGLDAWLNPGDKYRALYIANDEYNLLRLELEFVDAADASAVGTKLEVYKQIALRLQKAVLP